MNRRRPGSFNCFVLILAAFLAVIGHAPTASAAQATGERGGDPGAEQFVQTEAQGIISILADRRQSPAAKDRAFDQALDRIADVPRITNFVLGKYARTITPAERQQFTAAFRTYAENVYQGRIGDYRGEKLQVTGSVMRKSGDVVVNTVISGGQIQQPLAVGWRVLNSGGAWKIVDVQFKGVWLAITQQQDFVSTIDNAGGDVGVLISELQRTGHSRNP